MKFKKFLNEVIFKYNLNNFSENNIKTLDILILLF